MSCYIVAPDTMGRVINAALLLAEITTNQGRGQLALCGVPVTLETRPALWAKLYNVNAAAFTGRYQGRYDDDAEPAEYETPADLAYDPASIVAYARAVESLGYQCAEEPVYSGPDFADLEALEHWILEAARRATGAASVESLKASAAWEQAPRGY